MPFAVALDRGDVQLSACPVLSEEQTTAISPLLENSGDWREELAADLQGRLPGLDASLYPPVLGVTSPEPGVLCLPYLGSDLCIDAEGFRGPATVWDRILVLRYLLNAGAGPLREHPVAFRELKDGSVKATAFAGECERPLARLYGTDEQTFAGGSKRSAHS